MQTRLPVPLLPERQVRPAAPLTISIARAVGAHHGPSGVTGHRPSAAHSIQQIAVTHAATGPAVLFGEQGMDTEVLNQRMLGHLCTHAPVDDCELLLHMIAHQCAFQKLPGMIQVSDKELAKALLLRNLPMRKAAAKCLPETLVHRLMAWPGLAYDFIRFDPFLFLYAPQELKTRDSLAALLADVPQEDRHILVLPIAHQDLHLALSLASAEEVIKVAPHLLFKLTPPQQTPKLRAIAVSSDPLLLARLQPHISDAEYERLCDLLIRQAGSSLEHIAPDKRTVRRVDLAVAHRHPAHIRDIPARLVNQKRLGLALKNASLFRYFYPDSLRSHFLTHWHLWNTLKQKKDWLRFLPESERTGKLCEEYIRQYPAEAYSDHVPEAIARRHPEWVDRLWQASCYRSLSRRLETRRQRLDDALLTRLLDDGSAIVHEWFDFPPASQMPPWALLVEGFLEKLDPAHRNQIWRNGGACGLADAFQAPAFRIDPQALLDPLQEQLCTYRATCLPGQVVKKLMFCQPFRPVHAELGAGLHQQIVRLTRWLRLAMATGRLPYWSPAGTTATTAWKVRGGRTLARWEANGYVHMKFQRRGESLKSFAAEQAAQDFARTHKKLGWHSEIPTPEGIWLVPLDKLPVTQDSFSDALETHQLQGRACALALRFTTLDESYDTQAFQPDAQGSFTPARQGLLRAFHDLGVWSSLGALHTSTISLYHHFVDSDTASRPELLLNTCFQPGQLYPGSLHLWNTQATERSDWGWSGLRDLGDMEFYPFIHTYVTSLDAQAMIPDYSQRASFVNAIAQNILGGLLHYMRLQRSANPNYHYKTPESIADMKHFIEQACDTLLAGLLGDGDDARLKNLFASTGPGLSDVYPEWLHQTAREIIYWSARQTQDGDGFARHLNQNGRPCAELYPGHPWQDIRYGDGEQDDYTEAAGESLGTDNGKLPLFFLVRGLYVLAAGLADRLTQPQQPPAS